MVKLRADEKALEFEGFTTPTAAHRVDPTRVWGAGCFIVVLVVMAIAFVAAGILFSDDDEQKNLWLLLLIFFGFAIGWLGFAWWMMARLGRGRKQRVLVYPEGIVFWRDEEPVAYAWREIVSVSRKQEAVTPMHGVLVLWALVGKDFEVTIKFEDDTQVKLTALLLGVVQLADHIEEKIAEARPAPKRSAPKTSAPGKPGSAEPPTQVGGNPFDFD